VKLLKLARAMKEQNTAAGAKRRKYDASFKQEVLQMIYHGRPVSEVAQSLGIGENIIYRWKSTASVQQQQPDGPAAAGSSSSLSSGGTPTTKATAEEMLTLHRRIEQLEQERDILKKALAIFSRQT
jgi:transposase